MRKLDLKVGCSWLVRIKSESHSHEQVSLCYHGVCCACDASVGSELFGGSTLHRYHFHRQKKTHRSVVFTAVSESLPVSSPDVSGVQT